MKDRKHVETLYDCIALVASIYGWTHDYIMKLPTRVLFRYYNRIPAIEARGQLMSFESSMFPHQTAHVKLGMFNKYLNLYASDKQTSKEKTERINKNWKSLKNGAK